METRVERTDYVPDPNVKLLNPERGFYYNGDGLPESDDYNDNLLSEETWVSDKPAHTIVPRYLYLTDECNDDLTWAGVNHPDTCQVLKNYAKQLEECRAAGVKVLFRPRYDTEKAPATLPAPECGLFHADTIERQENHIRAVAAMLAEYKDVVAFIQAGYLGRWGEWNTDEHPGTAPFLYDYPTRERIIDYVLAQYELKEIEQDVELRRPVFAKEVLDRNPDAKVGLHSDCYLLNDSHGGTYSDFTLEDGSSGSEKNFGDVEKAEAYAQWLTANASFGGETCPHIVDEVEIKDELWRDCATMVDETAAMHMSYLNGDYAEGAVDHWRVNGCLDNLLEKLGYRFVVTRVEYPETVSAGDTFSVAVDVVNTGWARLHKPRIAKLVLRLVAPPDPDKEVYVLDGGKVETWEPGWEPGDEPNQLSITEQEAPSTPGKYSARLWIPDPDLQDNDPDEVLEAQGDLPKATINYAVKLATLRDDGTNVFDQATGENDLGVEIEVQ